MSTKSRAGQLLEKMESIVGKGGPELKAWILDEHKNLEHFLKVGFDPHEDLDDTPEAAEEFIKAITEVFGSGRTVFSIDNDDEITTERDEDPYQDEFEKIVNKLIKTGKLIFEGEEVVAYEAKLGNGPAVVIMTDDEDFEVILVFTDKDQFHGNTRNTQYQVK